MTIHELIEKCKSREVYTALLIVLVGFGAFGLGRLSRLEEGREPIRITQRISSQSASAVGSVTGGRTEVDNSPEVSVPAGGKVIASRNGTKYYFPWCSSNIAEKNKIWFNSEAEARAKGYQPAANCKGLK